MRPWFIVICIISFHHRTPICANFCLIDFSISQRGCIYASWIAQEALILRFFRTGPPLTTKSTSATFANHVHIYCITDILFCTTDFIAVQIIVRSCLSFVIHVPPGAPFIVYIYNISLHFRKRRVIANDFLRLDTSQHFIVACQKPFLLVFTAIMFMA